MNTSVILGDGEGRVIDGKFTLLQRLGGTGSSGVFLTELAGDVPKKAAIKFTPADAEHADARVAEWVAARALSHPNLMRLFHTGRCRIGDTDLLYTVTEYAEQNLAEILPERPLTSAETREMLGPVLDALAYLHGKGFVHGHLKPSNIMVVEDQLKLPVDGLYLSDRYWKHPATPGAYDAPETATRMSAAADIWSLGVTLVETLTQQRPRWDKSRAADPVVPESMPQPFADIARECLRRDPARRCTVDKVRARLDAALEPARGLSARTREGDKWISAKFHAAAIIAAVVALLSLIAVALFSAHKADLGLKPGTAAPGLNPGTAKSAPDGAAVRAPVQAPSSIPASQPAKGSTVKGAVAERVMPDVPPNALGTIREAVHVPILVAVDANGDVARARPEMPGASRHFANLALHAAKRWRFKPAQVDGRAVSSIWILHFEFSQTGTEVTPIEISP